jgi:hypothetical protein
MLFCKGQESKKQEVEEEVNRRSAFVDSLVNPGESPNPAPPTANKVELAFPLKNDETKQASSGFEKQKDDSMDELKLSFLCWGSLLNDDSETVLSFANCFSNSHCLWATVEEHF